MGGYELHGLNPVEDLVEGLFEDVETSGDSFGHSFEGFDSVFGSLNAGFVIGLEFFEGLFGEVLLGHFSYESIEVGGIGLLANFILEVGLEVIESLIDIGAESINTVGEIVKVILEGAETGVEGVDKGAESEGVNLNLLVEVVLGIRNLLVVVGADSFVGSGVSVYEVLVTGHDGIEEVGIDGINIILGLFLIEKEVGIDGVDSGIDFPNGLSVLLINEVHAVTDNNEVGNHTALNSVEFVDIGPNGIVTRGLVVQDVKNILDILLVVSETGDDLGVLGVDVSLDGLISSLVVGLNGLDQRLEGSEVGSSQFLQGSDSVGVGLDVFLVVVETEFDSLDLGLDSRDFGVLHLIHLSVEGNDGFLVGLDVGLHAIELGLDLGFVSYEGGGELGVLGFHEFLQGSDLLVGVGLAGGDILGDLDLKGVEATLKTFNGLILSTVLNSLIGKSGLHVADGLADLGVVVIDGILDGCGQFDILVLKVADLGIGVTNSFDKVGLGILEGLIQRIVLGEELVVLVGLVLEVGGKVRLQRGVVLLHKGFEGLQLGLKSRDGVVSGARGDLVDLVLEALDVGLVVFTTGDSEERSSEERRGAFNEREFHNIELMD